MVGKGICWLTQGMTKLTTKLSGGVQVFVYGTLKPGEVNYQRYCAGKVVACQKATALGQLFALPMGYPAMTTGEDLVQGYVLSFADWGILDELDELEDYQPHRHSSQNLYYRQQMQVNNLEGLVLDSAWVYLMNQEKIKKLGGVLLPDGWWRSFS